MVLQAGGVNYCSIVIFSFFEVLAFLSHFNRLFGTRPTQTCEIQWVLGSIL